MKRFSWIAIAASFAINAGALAVIASGIDESSLPQGQVTITEIDSAQTPVYARAEGSEVRGAVAL